MRMIIVIFLRGLLWNIKYINEPLYLTFFNKCPANAKFCITGNYEDKDGNDADIIIQWEI